MTIRIEDEVIQRDKFDGASFLLMVVVLGSDGVPTVLQRYFAGGETRRWRLRLEVLTMLQDHRLEQVVGHGAKVLR